MYEHMLSKEHKEIAQEVIEIFTSFGDFTVESINEGSCEEFAEYLNGQYGRKGLTMHQLLSTDRFISPNAEENYENDDCIYMKNWKEELMASLGVPFDYFQEYRKQVEAFDPIGRVGYHVWLFDGEHHYDATCLEGVKNPLELPFFQLFTKERKQD